MAHGRMLAGRGITGEITIRQPHAALPALAFKQACERLTLLQFAAESSGPSTKSRSQLHIPAQRNLSSGWHL